MITLGEVVILQKVWNRITGRIRDWNDAQVPAINKLWERTEDLHGIARVVVRPLLVSSWSLCVSLVCPDRKHPYLNVEVRELSPEHFEKIHAVQVGGLAGLWMTLNSRLFSDGLGPVEAEQALRTGLGNVFQSALAIETMDAVMRSIGPNPALAAEEIWNRVVDVTEAPNGNNPLTRTAYITELLLRGEMEFSEINQGIQG